MAKQDQFGWTLYGISPYASSTQFVEQMAKKRTEEDNVGATAAGTVAAANSQ